MESDTVVPIATAVGKVVVVVFIGEQGVVAVVYVSPLDVLMRCPGFPELHTARLAFDADVEQPAVTPATETSNPTTTKSRPTTSFCPVQERRTSVTIQGPHRAGQGVSITAPLPVAHGGSPGSTTAPAANASVNARSTALIAETLGVSRKTVYRHLAPMG
jgi:hypothetical protein